MSEEALLNEGGIEVTRSRVRTPTETIRLADVRGTVWISRTGVWAKILGLLLMLAGLAMFGLGVAPASTALVALVATPGPGDPSPVSMFISMFTAGLFLGSPLWCSGAGLGLAGAVVLAVFRTKYRVGIGSRRILITGDRDRAKRVRAALDQALG